MPASLRTHLARSNTRPYDRRSPAPSSPALSETSQLQLQYPLSPDVDSPSSPALPPPPPIADHPGMPTYTQYRRIEANYIKSLSPRKRDKALITQAMFDKIWDVLHQPDACTIETPQFRFWVRKMFTLGRPNLHDNGGYENDSGDDDDEAHEDVEMPTAVVLHENRPVAVMEQLYELFCYCHERSGHGGRDKTCAVIRQHYSWVPKELTAQFVKACPTCTVKRSGNPEMVMLVQGETLTPRKSSRFGREKRGIGEVGKEDGRGVPSSLGSPGWPTTGGPLDPDNPAPCGVRDRERQRERDEEGKEENERKRKRHAGDESDVGPSSGELHTAYNGSPHSSIDSSDSVIRPILKEPTLPNPPQGWALGVLPCADVSGSKLDDTGGRSGSKFTNVLLPQGLSDENSEPIDSQKKLVSTGMKLPSLTSALSNGSLDDKLDLTGIGRGNLDDSGCLPPVLRQLQISEPVTHQAPSYLFQIDPVLLAFNYPGSSIATAPTSRTVPPLTAFGMSVNGLDLPPLDIQNTRISRNTTCTDTLPNLEGTSDPRILPFWAGLPSTLSNGALSLGLSPLCTSNRDVDFEMGGLAEMEIDPDRSTSTASSGSTDSPDSSFEYSGTYTGAGTTAFPFKISSPVGCGSRCEYGTLAGLLPCTTDEVGQELARTLSFPLMTDDA